jgi:hypothetical protein
MQIGLVSKTQRSSELVTLSSWDMLQLCGALNYKSQLPFFYQAEYIALLQMRDMIWCRTLLAEMGFAMKSHQSFLKTTTLPPVSRHLINNILESNTLKSKNTLSETEF